MQIHVIIPTLFWAILKEIEMALNIYLIRHGKTVWNIEGRLQGSCDSPLVEEGIEGAKKAGQALKAVQFSAAYSSMQKRAQDTANYILAENETQNVPHFHHWGLNEFDFSQVAQRIAEKLFKKYDGKLPARALQEKIIQNLANKGFSYADAKWAFEQLDSQVDEDTTQELIFKELDKQYTKYARKYEGYELKQRLTQVLARKGYDFSDIASALREYL